jgi:hypothetical protein
MFSYIIITRHEYKIRSLSLYCRLDQSPYQHLAKILCPYLQYYVFIQ